MKYDNEDDFASIIFGIVVVVWGELEAISRVDDKDHVLSLIVINVCGVGNGVGWRKTKIILNSDDDEIWKYIR